MIKKIDMCEKKIIMHDVIIINIDQIYEIYGEIFNDSKFNF